MIRQISRAAAGSRYHGRVFSRKPLLAFITFRISVQGAICEICVKLAFAPGNSQCLTRPARADAQSAGGPARRVPLGRREVRGPRRSSQARQVEKRVCHLVGPGQMAHLRLEIQKPDDGADSKTARTVGRPLSPCSSTPACLSSESRSVPDRTPIDRAWGGC